MDIRNITFLVLFFAIIAGLIGAVKFIGSRLQKYLYKKKYPLSSIELTPTGVCLMMAMVSVMFAALAAAKLQPNGPLGSLLQSPVNLAVGCLVLLLVTWVFALLFTAIGTTIVRRRKD